MREPPSFRSPTPKRMLRMAGARFIFWMEESKRKPFYNLLKPPPRPESFTSRPLDSGRFFIPNPDKTGTTGIKKVAHRI